MHRARFETRAVAIALRGLTLKERLRSTAGSRKFIKIDNQRNAERVKTWRSWFDRSKAATGWRNFLAENNLTEKQLLALDSLPRTNRHLPAWTTTLDQLCRYLENASLESSDGLSASENLASAVVGFAWSEFSKCANSGLLADGAAMALKQSLLRRLVWTADQAVTWEISVAHSARRVSMDLEPEHNFQRYFFSSGVAPEVLGLMQNYPALARLWSVQIESWSCYLREFLEDAALFARRGGICIAKGGMIISSVDVDLSDPHEGNRAALGVGFAGGTKWFYKPRSGRQERAWFDLLDWLNVHGFRPRFEILKVNCQDRHYWMESVSARPCRNEREARLFCFRSGALMCLIHLLRGVDFHHENVVVAGSQPVVVDCETLLHPATLRPEYARAEDDSIGRTGMLMLIKRIPNGVLGWQGKGDGLLHELINGFIAMHQFMQHDSSLRYLRRWVDRLRMVPARRIYRPTAHYHGMLSQSLAPSLMVNGLERSLYLSACCRDGVNPARRLRAEVAALQNADIPVFRGKPRGIRFDLSKKTLRQSIAVITAAFRNTGGSRQV